MLKILIAEDDRELRQLFEHVLMKHDYSVKGVSNGKEALAAIDEDDQLAGAVALAEKAVARIKPGEDPRKAANRILAMLARRGYGWDLAKEALQQAMADIANDDEL